MHLLRRESDAHARAAQPEAQRPPQHLALRDARRREEGRLAAALSLPPRLGEEGGALPVDAVEGEAADAHPVGPDVHEREEQEGRPPATRGRSGGGQAQITGGREQHGGGRPTSSRPSRPAG